MVATLALWTRKYQSTAQRQTDFLDAITDSIHDFIIQMAAPIAFVKFTKVAIKCHADPAQVDTRLSTYGAIAYIERKGKDDSKQLGELLDNIRPIVSKIRTLVAKGQVLLGFRNYNECRDSCDLITWQYDRIQAFSQVIGGTTLYWENPEVKDTVDKVLSIEVEDIEIYLQKQNINLLEFVRTNYNTRIVVTFLGSYTAKDHNRPDGFNAMHQSFLRALAADHRGPSKKRS